MMYKDNSLVLAIVLLVFLYNEAKAGPMHRLSRMAREVYPEIEPESEGNQAQVCIVGDVVYGVEEAVPADQSCLKCRCQPPGVQCETIQCLKKPGCKTVHRPNSCCPDYQCECEHNGKIYANGERLDVQPGGECKVCYCRGGELQCAEVSCYVRNDCEGKRVPGTCCLKYDHCPPIDPVQDRPLFTTEVTPLVTNQEIQDLWPVTALPTNSTFSILGPTSNEIQDENKIPDTNEDKATTSSYKFEKVPREKGILPRITIQEIIPERKEIPMTAPPKVQQPHQGTLLIEEAVETQPNDLSDSEPDSSEISEVFQHPPPVLRIGDKLLFLKKGEFVPERDTSTPSSVITIIGAEGLQRGFEESGEVHEVKIEPTPKDSTSTTILEKDDNDIELKTSASTHILSLVKRKNKPATTEVPTTIKTGLSTTLVPLETSSFFLLENEEHSTREPILSSEPIPKVEGLKEKESSTQKSEVTTKYETDTLTTILTLNQTDTDDPDNSTEIKVVSTETLPKNTEPILEQNPAYPPIPDIMASNIDDTSQRFDIDEKQKSSDSENTTIEIKILPEVLNIRSNKTVPQNGTHGEWLKNRNNNESLINYKASLPEELLKQPSPIDFDESTEITTDIAFTSTIADTNISFEANNEKLVTTAFPTVNDENVSNKNDENFNVTATTTEESLRVVDHENKFNDTAKTTEENVRTVESLEIEQSKEEIGESTTPKSNSASIISTENASVEKLDKETEATDMLNFTSEIIDATSSENIEATTKSVYEAVEIIDKINIPEETKTGIRPLKEDVEFVNLDSLQKPEPTQMSKKIEVTTHELLPQPQEAIQLPLKIILKRANNPDAEAKEVFRELDQELNADLTERTLTDNEEKNESDQIFKELLDETSTRNPKVDTAKPRNRDEESIQRVTDALAKLTLRGKQADSSVLGVLSNFFSSQYSLNKK